MFERAVDKRVYEEELLGWLPERIIDCHVHIGLPEFCGPMSEERLRSNWAMEVGAEQSWEQWRASRDMLFPRQKVMALRGAQLTPHHLQLLRTHWYSVPRFWRGRSHTNGYL